MKYGLSLALLVVCAFVGCSSEQPSLKQVDVRAELKNKFAAALSNIAKEGESIRIMQNAISAALENLAKENGSVSDIEDIVKMQLTEMFPSGDLINGMIQQMLDSDFAKAIFSESNVISSSDTEVTYRLSLPLCEKLNTLVAGGDGAGLVMMCKLFLSHNTIDLHVKARTENSIELELHHAANVDGSQEPKFVLSILASPNLLGTRLSLDGAKELVEAVQTFMPEAISVGNAEIEGFKTLTGEFSLRLQFASQNAGSGCQNDERLCFVANVDRDIKIETKGEPLFSLSIGHSSTDRPSATVTAQSGGNFAGAFNLGAIEASYGDKEDAYKIFLETISFKVSVPKAENDERTAIFFEKIKTGPRAAYLQFGPHKATIELTNSSKSVDLIKTYMGTYGKSSEITLSPMALTFTYTDESKENCKSFESLQIKTSGTSLTTIKGDAVSPGVTTETCEPNMLNGYVILSTASVINDSEVCSESNHMQVKKGSLAVQYEYSLNNSAKGTLSVDLAEGQCLGF